VRRVHPRTPVPYLQHRARPHRTPICDGSRLPGQPFRPTPRRRLAFNQAMESPLPRATRRRFRGSAASAAVRREADPSQRQVELGTIVLSAHLVLSIGTMPLCGRSHEMRFSGVASDLGRIPASHHQVGARLGAPFAHGCSVVLGCACFCSFLTWACGTGRRLGEWWWQSLQASDIPVGRRFRAENRGWRLPADAVSRLIVEVVYKPGAGSRLRGRSVLLRARGLDFSSCALGSCGHRPPA
jgi:hypothetical protein